MASAKNLRQLHGFIYIFYVLFSLSPLIWSDHPNLATGVGIFENTDETLQQHRSFHSVNDPWTVEVHQVPRNRAQMHRTGKWARLNSAGCDRSSWQLTGLASPCPRDIWSKWPYFWPDGGVTSPHVTSLVPLRSHSSCEVSSVLMVDPLTFHIIVIVVGST